MMCIKFTKIFTLTVLALNLMSNTVFADECTELINKEEYYEAVEYCQKGADRGDKVSQFFLGTLYYNAQGVMGDKVKAINWIKKSAQQHFPLAQYNLGVIYANGDGVEADLVNGYSWLRVAEQNGYQQAKAVADEIEKELTKEERKLSKELISQLSAKK